MAPRSRLSDITLRANNSHQHSARQVTLFDAFNTAQRRNKRQRQQQSASDRENIGDHAHIPNKKIVRRSRSTLTKQTSVTVQHANCTATKSCQLAPVPPRRMVPAQHNRFGLCSPRHAINMRQQQLVDMRCVSTVQQLRVFVSPTARTFNMYAPDNSLDNNRPLACKYNGRAGSRSRLALVDEAGSISIFDTASERDDEGMVPAARWRGHDDLISDFEWRQGDAQLLTASADETCRLWDVEQQALLGVFRGHTQTVRSVSWRHDDANCFVSSSRDGSIMMWDVRCNKTNVDDLYTYRPVNTISAAHHESVHAAKSHVSRTGGPVGSVTGVQSLTHNPNIVASVGSINAAVKYWDVRANYSARATPTPAAKSLLPKSPKSPRGASSLTLDPDGTRLYSASKDSSVYVHNTLAPGIPITQLAAPEFICDSFNINTSISPCGQYLAAGSANGSVVIWELDRYGFNSSKRRVVLQGHSKEAGCVAWYPFLDRTQLVTCGDDKMMRVWDIDAELAEMGRNDPVKRCQWGFATVVTEP